MKKINSLIREIDGTYTATGKVSRQEIITLAKTLTRASIRKGAECLSSPDHVRDYLLLHFQHKSNEQFWCLYLDNKHKALANEIICKGTLSSATVYPRTIVQRVIHHNAGAVIFAHNHPSGDTTPSDADRQLIRRLKEALGLIDVRVLDSLVIGHDDVVSMQELGMM